MSTLLVVYGAFSPAQAARCRWPADTAQLVFGRTSPTRIFGMNDVLTAPMPAFRQTFRKHANPCFHVWKSEGCVMPVRLPSEPAFLNSCLRRDWGYRTLKAADRHYGGHALWNRYNKAAVDTRFLADMRAKCASQHLAPTQLQRCLQRASLYYLAASTHGLDTYKLWVDYLLPFDGLRQAA
jgi:hypothetical protein